MIPYVARPWSISIRLTVQARETIKNVNVDSSGRLEVEDWVQLHSLLRAGKSQPVYVYVYFRKYAHAAGG